MLGNVRATWGAVHSWKVKNTKGEFVRAILSFEHPDAARQNVRELFEEFLAERAPAYTTQTYNLLRHNCNHFTEGESKRKRRAAGRMRSDSDACVIPFLRGRRVRAVPRRHLHPRLDSRRARHRPSYSDRSAVCSDV